MDRVEAYLEYRVSYIVTLIVTFNLPVLHAKDVLSIINFPFDGGLDVIRERLNSSIMK
jgi:hypothetical protein